ncbi:MAG: M48 family metallopeptidase [Burkholderiales bacterium]|nr:M48 family metallopeptidase [Burkholderiales bacterium]
MAWFSFNSLKLIVIGALISAGLITAGCQTTTAGGEVGVDRRQFLLVSSEQAEAGAAQFYAQEMQKFSSKGALNVNPQQTARVREIASRLIAQVGAFRPDARNWKWEVNVINSKELNAYCAAGGKIAVYSGLIDSLHLSDDEIAAVMGHEIAHALREHTREAMSEAVAQQVGVSVLASLAGLGQGATSLLSAATDVAIGLPFSRQKEREADEIGVELMARAAYDPRSAVTVWRKMISGGGGRPPEILSTHPDPANRIKDIESHLPRVIPLYEATKRTGRK